MVGFVRPLRLAWPRTPPFHGGDTGSNPVGDAILKKVTFLRISGLFLFALILSNRDQIKGFPEVYRQFTPRPGGVRTHTIQQFALFLRNLCRVKRGGLLREFEYAVAICN